MQKLGSIKIEEKIWEYKTIYMEALDVSEYYLGKFANKVNEACKQGYEISGGLSIVVLDEKYSTNYKFVQAMKRKVAKNQ